MIVLRLNNNHAVSTTLNETDKHGMTIPFIRLSSNQRKMNLSTSRSLYNQCVKWIPEPVTLFAYAKNPPEPLTTYARRYVSREDLQ